MKDPKRITGFMAFAKDLITDEPGLTAQEVYVQAARYSEDTGVSLSAAGNPQGSLVATLHKSHRDYGLERRPGRDGKNRFYLAGQESLVDPATSRPSAPDGQNAEHDPIEMGASMQHQYNGENHRWDGRCCIDIRPQDMSRIKALVALGLYPNEHQAHRELVEKGLEVVVAKLST